MRSSVSFAIVSSKVKVYLIDKRTMREIILPPFSELAAVIKEFLLRSTRTELILSLSSCYVFLIRLFNLRVCICGADISAIPNLLPSCELMAIPLGSLLINTNSWKFSSYMQRRHS